MQLMKWWRKRKVPAYCEPGLVLHNRPSVEMLEDRTLLNFGTFLNPVPRPVVVVDDTNQGIYSQYGFTASPGPSQDFFSVFTTSLPTPTDGLLSVAVTGLPTAPCPCGDRAAPCFRTANCWLRMTVYLECQTRQ